MRVGDEDPDLLTCPEDRGQALLGREANERDPADLDGLLAWLRAVCRGGVILIPRDRQLASGDLLIPSALAPATRAAHLTVAAAVATRFPVAGE